LSSTVKILAKKWSNQIKSKSFIYTDPILYYTFAKEMYSIVLRAHLNTGHGGREKMLKEVNKKYANVTRDVLNLFKEMCEECQLKKRKIASKGLVFKPLLSKDFNSRGQVDLVDPHIFQFLNNICCKFTSIV
jgi:hypothetical protein